MFFFETLLYNKDKPILIGEIRYNYVPFAKVSHDLVTIIHSTITNRYIKTIYIANGNIIHSETTLDNEIWFRCFTTVRDGSRNFQWGCKLFLRRKTVVPGRPHTVRHLVSAKIRGRGKPYFCKNKDMLTPGAPPP